MPEDEAREPSAVFAPCPDCGRSKSTVLTLVESQELSGYAKTNCRTCCLTDVPRPAPAATRCVECAARLAGRESYRGRPGECVDCDRAFAVAFQRLMTRPQSNPRRG